jgi:hypothetical protein
MSRRAELLARHVVPRGEITCPCSAAEVAARQSKDSPAPLKHAAHRLSTNQLAFFDTFGYLVFPGLLADCAERIIESFEAVWAAHGGGHNNQPHDPTQRSCIVPFPDQSVFLSSLLDDGRIWGPVASLLGDDFNYTSGDGNIYAGDTHWHSDGYGRRSNGRGDGRFSIKMAFYLDTLTKDTGAVRFIPGSHKVGDTYGDAVEAGCKSRDQKKTNRSSSARGSNAIDDWGIDGPSVPAVCIESKPGDVVVFAHNLKHASFGGGGTRRMYTMNFCERYPVSLNQASTFRYVVQRTICLSCQLYAGRSD